MEHAGESGVQLSVGAEMEAYGNQVAAASKPFCCKSKRDQAGDHAITNTEGYNWQGHDRVILANYIF